MLIDQSSEIAAIRHDRAKIDSAEDRESGEDRFVELGVELS